MRDKAATPSSKQDLRPTPDQMYLAGRLSHDTLWQFPDGTADEGPHQITPAVLQKWNKNFGVAAVTAALRSAWGFPPEGGISNPYAYVAAILKGDS